MRKTLTKQITFTTCNVAQLQIINGTPTVVEHGQERILGNASKAKLEREINQLYKDKKDKQFPYTVYNIQTETKTFEMPIETFLKYATEKDDKQ